MPLLEILNCIVLWHMHVFRNSGGLTILESLVAILVVSIATMAAAVVFNNYWAISSDLSREGKSNDLSVTIFTDVFKSPRYKIARLCSDKNAWEQRTSSPCEAISLETEKVGVPINAENINDIPAMGELLGKNLAFFIGPHYASPSCIDLMYCKYIVANQLLELSFNYYYFSTKSQKLEFKTVKIRRGPW
ncbi:hypothetical protein [uncultured Bdellovibrio sp.]|uniref:hypothetical protein n=1 Tax=Bdellovibrio sp. HCB-162 TaxID=3394234 RepID=UPI0025D6D906|nr:hypothetical protein [uncultured Bdellovibrio sp.]